MKCASCQTGAIQAAIRKTGVFSARILKSDGFEAGILKSNGVKADLRTVIPAQAGTHAARAARRSMLSIGSRLRGNDDFTVGGLTAGVFSAGILKSDGFKAGIQKSDGVKAATFQTVVPAQAGIHAERAALESTLSMGSGLRRNDGFTSSILKSDGLTAGRPGTMR